MLAGWGPRCPGCYLEEREQMSAETSEAPTERLLTRPSGDTTTAKFTL